MQVTQTQVNEIMKAPAIPSNSYFACAHTNKQFDCALDDILSHFRTENSEIHWWAPNHTNPLHCTLGFFMDEKKTAQEDQIASLFEKAMANKSCSESLKFTGCMIANNGWAVLKIEPSEELQKMHEEIVEDMKSQGLTPSKFSLENYMPHISIGTVKNPKRSESAFNELIGVLYFAQTKGLHFDMDELEIKHADLSLKKITPLKNDLEINTSTCIWEGQKNEEQTLKGHSVKPAKL